MNTIGRISFIVVFSALMIGAVDCLRPVEAQPFVPQPAGEHSSVVCWRNPGAPAGSLERLGIVFDYQLASALNAAIAAAPVQPNYLMLQFNECFGGGMIDDLFNFAAYPNLAIPTMIAASASQHDEASFSNGTCNGGMGYGRPYAVAFTWNPVPTQRNAFLWAERWDPFGPFGTSQENPQYMVNPAVAGNPFRVGTWPNRRGLVFVGNPTGRNDYHRDVGRAWFLLLRSYPAAATQAMNGAGFAANAVCPAVPLTNRARRSDLLAGIAALPTAAMGPKEYFLWFGDHGSRWIFVLGPGGMMRAVPLGAVNGNANADVKFDATVQDSALLFVQSESVPTVPVRVLVNATQIYQGNLVPGDNVLTLPGSLVVPGNNAIEIDNLSPTDSLDVSSIALGTGDVSTVSATELCDLNADGTVDLTDFNLFLAAFGNNMASPDSVITAYNPNADFDDDQAITLVDYQTWFECYATLPRQRK